MSAVTFQYSAVDRAGARHSGATQAASRGEAYRKIAALGLTPVQIKAAGEAGGGLLGRGSRKARPKDIAHFTYQLGVLISARIPLSEGLLSIAAQEREGQLKDVITDIAHRVQAGEQIATALEQHERVFGSVYISTIRAAERAGTMSRVLDHLSDMLERQQESRSQLRGALMYPACVVSVLLLAVTFLVAFVVPRFAGMFEKRGLELPLFTKALMGLGLSVQHYWWAYLIAIAAAVFGLRRTMGSQSGRERIDRLLHKVPYIRSILEGLAIARFTRVLGISLSSGLNLIEAIELSGKASGRPLLQADAQKMIDQVRTGGRLGEVLGTCNYLTPFTKRMLGAGDQSAELPRMCDIVARHYDRESAQLAKNIGTVIEPVLIVLIAMVVLAVALAIFLPMWDMVKLVG